jgi:hypothetical protein
LLALQHPWDFIGTLPLSICCHAYVYINYMSMYEGLQLLFKIVKNANIYICCRLGIRSLVLESSDGLRITGFAFATWTNAWKALDAVGLGDSLRANHQRLYGYITRTHPLFINYCHAPFLVIYVGNMLVQYH